MLHRSIMQSLYIPNAMHVKHVQSKFRITCNISRDRDNRNPSPRKPPSKRTQNTRIPPSQRQSQSSPPPSRALPKFNMLIVVEGINDMKAVHRSVDADVYVLGSATKAFTSSTIDDLRDLSQKYPGILLLLDPDVAGRQARNAINDTIEGCWHAFIPAPAATTEIDLKYKEKGNVGVEHAAPSSILRALSSRRQSTPGKGVFTRELLQDMGLIATTALPEKKTTTTTTNSNSNTTTSSKPWSVSLARQYVCEYLGLGVCDGKQLLRQLNSYGFTVSDVENALEWSRERMDVMMHMNKEREEQ